MTWTSSLISTTKTTTASAAAASRSAADLASPNMNLQRSVFARLYRKSPDVNTLPWHREQPPALLERAIDRRGTPGRALDVGCGEGVYTVHLAQAGYRVVGVDFVPAALDAARARAALAGVEVELRECEVTEYNATAPFDIVLDSGCLHHLPRGRVAAYRDRLDQWLAPGGDYILVHFSNRPRVGWIPKGPGRLTRDQAVDLFAPFELQAEDETEFDVPFPMGRMRAGIYWFTRPGR